MPQLDPCDSIMDKLCTPVRLQPFLHQVGGHAAMLSYDDMTVCKPLVTREHQFYQKLPKELQEFAPVYKGDIEVNFKEDSDGFVTFLGYPTEHPSVKKARTDHDRRRDSCGEGDRSDSDTDSQDSTSSPKPEASDDDMFRLRMRSSGRIEINNPQSVDPEQSSESSTSWSAQCHKRQLEQMIKDSIKAKNKTRKFILLENLTSRFQYPCILDIKVGTRQHGDDQNEEKVKRKLKRCANTTSSSLGLRLGGMQVYQVPSGKFLSKDKYWGRSLTSEGFLTALNNFFDNGNGIRVDIVEPMIERLVAFKEMVEIHDTFRFYSSSLLLMYDGKPPEPVLEKETKVPCENECVAGGSSEGNGNINSGRASEPGGVVDVRMVDFEHSTFQGFREGGKVHPGPDKGYLFGLNNLIKALEDMRTKKSLKT